MKNNILEKLTQKDLDNLILEKEAIEQLNFKLKNRIKELESGFKAVVEELCEYAIKNNELQLIISKEKEDIIWV